MNIHLWNEKEKDVIEFVMGNFGVINTSKLHNPLLDKTKAAYKHGPQGIYEAQESFTKAMQFLKKVIEDQKSKERNEITSGNINDRVSL